MVRAGLAAAAAAAAVGARVAGALLALAPALAAAAPAAAVVVSVVASVVVLAGCGAAAGAAAVARTAGLRMRSRTAGPAVGTAAPAAARTRLAAHPHPRRGSPHQRPRAAGRAPVRRSPPAAAAARPRSLAAARGAPVLRRRAGAAGHRGRPSPRACRAPAAEAGPWPGPRSRGAAPRAVWAAPSVSERAPRQRTPWLGLLQRKRRPPSVRIHKTRAVAASCRDFQTAGELGRQKTAQQSRSFFRKRSRVRARCWCVPCRTSSRAAHTSPCARAHRARRLADARARPPPPGAAMGDSAYSFSLTTFRCAARPRGAAARPREGIYLRGARATRARRDLCRERAEWQSAGRQGRGGRGAGAPL